MKKIDISTPKYPNAFALVDDSDFDKLTKQIPYKWYARKESSGNVYAVRHSYIKSRSIRMHVAIMGHVTGKEIDHRNGNTLDNRRCNLRHCTRAENQRNRGAQKNNTSGYKGVSWYKGHNRWRVQIKHNGKKIHLGYFTCIVKAASAYDKAALELHGEFAKLNFEQGNTNE